MKIGMLTGLWFVSEKASLIQSLQRAASLGFHYVDIHGVFHAGPAHLSATERKAVRTELTNLNLTARSFILHPPINIPGANSLEFEQSQRYLEEGIDLAASWNINQIMLNAGQWIYGMTREIAWEKSVRFFQLICDYAASRDIFIAQEAEPYVWFLVNDIRSSKRMLADVERENFTILVDLGHMALTRENPQDLFEIGDAIIHAHFSDHQAYQHTNQIIGTGIARVADYLVMFNQMEIDRRVHRFGYDELVIAFEMGIPGDTIQEPDEWVKQSLNHVLACAAKQSINLTL